MRQAQFHNALAISVPFLFVILWKMTAGDLTSMIPAALSVPTAVIGARFGGAAGAVAGFFAGLSQAALASAAKPDAALAPLALATLALVAAGAGAGAAAKAHCGAHVRTAREVWTSLRLGQMSEFLSYCLYQLREYQISATALIESIGLCAPKDNAVLIERIEKLRRVMGELNDKAARLLGENSGVTTHPAQMSAVSIAATVREIVAEARSAFSGGGVAVSVVEDGALPTVTCDRRSLRLSLLAVVQNSIEACARNGRGRVSIIVRKRENRAEIEIADDGGGIDAPLTTLFEPFYAARSATTGMGLGLPMARRLIERAGGGIGVKSQDGLTAVLLELPIDRHLPFVRNEESTWAGRRHRV